jgi:hypothetical protein
MSGELPLVEAMPSSKGQQEFTTPACRTFSGRGLYGLLIAQESTLLTQAALTF